MCALGTIKTPRKDIQFLIRKRLKRTEGWVKEYNRRLNGSEDGEIKGEKRRYGRKEPDFFIVFTYATFMILPPSLPHCDPLQNNVVLKCHLDC